MECRIRLLAAIALVVAACAGVASGTSGGASAQGRSEASAPGRSEASAQSRTEGPLVYVFWPGARLQAWEEADGVPGRRFIDGVRERGWILRPDELSAREAGLIDRWREEVQTREDSLRPVVLWRNGAGPERETVLGAAGGETVLRAAGVSSEEIERLRTESRAWISSRILRADEVGEMLGLTAREGLAFRSLNDPAHPLGCLTSAFLEDKRAGNLSIYLLGSRRPPGIGLSLRLSSVYEERTAPFFREVLAAPPSAVVPDSLSSAGLPPEDRDQALGRFFAARVLASAGRVYGRCDRILQSLLVEGPKGTLLVIDGRESPDPFLVVQPAGRKLPSARMRGDLLERRLAAAHPFQDRAARAGATVQR